ncbi:MAG: hypothetical protein JO122_18125 [Acetobacteraceae bacterium]|nr:hypothetical protein [Acetobacteraceae bacterium]
MQEALTASIVLVLLVISTAVGIYIRHRLPDRHRSQETVNHHARAYSGSRRGGLRIPVIVNIRSGRS